MTESAKAIEAKNESKMTQGASLSEPIAKPSPPKGRKLFKTSDFNKLITWRVVKLIAQ